MDLNQVVSEAKFRSHKNSHLPVITDPPIKIPNTQISRLMIKSHYSLIICKSLGLAFLFSIMCPTLS